MNPAILETLKLMVGIVTSEKANAATKQDADAIIRKILPAISRDVDEYIKATSKLLQP